MSPFAGSRRRLLVVAPLILIAALLTLAGWPSEPPAPPPEGSFSFAVLADAPYYPQEVLPYRRLLRELDRAPLEWIIHLGDIFGIPCSERFYRSRLRYFENRRHPVVYTPGDNEWADCHLLLAGGHQPLERLRTLRSLFFSRPERALGQRPLRLVSQGVDGAAEHSEFVENVRWSHRGIVFATVHLVGGHNATTLFAGRSADDDEATRQRTRAAASWLRETFAHARDRGSSALFVGFHGDLSLDQPPDAPTRQVYEPFIQTLETEAASFDGVVVIAHGELHEFIVDQPLTNRATGAILENVTRLQVPGSPTIGWVQVTVTPGSPPTFDFEPHRVPVWRF